MSEFFYRGAKHDRQLRSEGIVGEPWSRTLATDTLATVSQTAYYMQIAMRAKELVDNVSCICTTAGSGLTSIYVGLYDADLVRVAVSTNQVGLGFGTGYLAFPLSAQYVVPDDDIYYTALLVVATTPPVLAGVSGLVDAAVGMPGGQVIRGEQTGQSTLPTTAVASNTTKAIWLPATATVAV